MFPLGCVFGLGAGATVLPLHLEACLGSPVQALCAWSIASSAMAALLRPLGLRMEVAGRIIWTRLHQHGP